MTRGSRLVLSLVTLFLLLMLLASGAVLLRDPQTPPTAATARVAIPVFDEVGLPFHHRYDRELALPFAGGAVIDVDGDGPEEIFLSGGRGQRDALLTFDGQGFVDISEGAGIDKTGPDGLDDASYGAISIDANLDGRVDLFVARQSGVYLLENLAGRFSSRRIETALDDNSIALSLAPTDLNQDGWVDLYVCAYLRRADVKGLTVFSDPDYGGSSRLLLNNGDNSFTDITEEAGLSYVHNTFQAVWSDADLDGDPDLIVAHDSGQVRTYRNLGGRRFELVSNPTSSRFSYPMGIALGDYDNDGLQDVFFSNTGTSVPRRLARGDLEEGQELDTEWILLRNRGGMAWFNEAEQARLADYEFGWGAVFADFNLDGLLDLVVSENFVDYPVHRFLKLPGRFLVQNPDHTFAPVGRQAGAENRHFGLTPLVADWNRDGAPDLVHVNVNGRSRGLVSRSASGRFLRVDLRDRVSSLGAVVSIETAGGERRVAELAGSVGLFSDQSHIFTFGLGDERQPIEKVEVRYSDGSLEVRRSVALDSTLRIDREVPESTPRTSPADALSSESSQP